MSGKEPPCSVSHSNLNRTIDIQLIGGRISLRKNNLSPPKGNSSLHEGNSSLHEGNSSLREGNTSLREGNSSLREGNSFLPAVSVLSPWMRPFPVTAHGVCLAFAYRLLGDKTELNVAIQRPRSQDEILWKVWSSEGNAVWKHGRVSLGVSLAV